MTAVSSVPRIFPRPNHPSNLYFSCPSFPIALTTLETRHWTHYYASGPVLHCESKSGPSVQFQWCWKLEPRIEASQNAWNHHKACLLYATLNRENQTKFRKGSSAWKRYLWALLFLNYIDLESEVLSTQGMGRTSTKSVVSHVCEVRFSEDFISVLELLLLTDLRAQLF